MVGKARKAARAVRRTVAGVDTPVGGFPLHSRRSDADVAQAVFRFLENQRILFSPLGFEHRDECRESLKMMREYLTEQLQTDGLGDDLVEHLSGMHETAIEVLDQAYFRRRNLPLTTGELRMHLKHLREDIGTDLRAMMRKYHLVVRPGFRELLRP